MTAGDNVQRDEKGSRTMPPFLTVLSSAHDSFENEIGAAVTAASAPSQIAGIAAAFGPVNPVRTSVEYATVEADGLELHPTMRNALTVVQDAATTMYNTAYPEVPLPPGQADAGCILHYHNAYEAPQDDCRLVQALVATFDNWGLRLTSEQAVGIIASINDDVEVAPGTVGAHNQRFQLSPDLMVQYALAFGVFKPNDVNDTLALIYAFCADQPTR